MYESNAPKQHSSLPPLHGPTTLRTIFPAAQFDAQITLPTPKAGVLSRRTGGRRAHRAIKMLIAIFMLAMILPFGGLLLAETSSTMAALIGVFTAVVSFLSTGVIFVAIFGLTGYAIIRTFIKSSKGTVITTWATERGFTEVDGSWMDDLNLKIARSGSSVTHHGAYKGSVGGIEAVVGSYTWVTGSGDNRRSGVVGLLVLRLPPSVAARFRSVAVAPAGEWSGLYGGRELRFESSVMDDQLQVRVDEQQDDVAVFELFNPTFIELLESRPDTKFEQRGEWLGLPISVYPTFRSGMKVTPPELDADCALALHISLRFCEEYQ